MTKPLLSIIIPVFNGLEYTQKSLKSLEKQISILPRDKSKIHIVVVDDGSSDGTYEWVKSNHPEVHILQGNGNLWWSGGVNKGMEYALEHLKTEYILWWNNDILPDDNYLKNLLQVIGKQPEDVVIGSKIFMLHKNLIWGMGGKFDPRKGTKHMYAERKEDGPELKKPFEVDWFPGMGTCFHKSVFDKIGYLDEENFPQYHGDSDFTLRAKKAGFRLIAFPELIIFNDTSNSGIVHQGSIGKLFKSFTSIKSNFNIQKNRLFLKRHADSRLAYLPLIRKYSKYVGGFLKWKFLGFLGVKKK